MARRSWRCRGQQYCMRRVDAVITSTVHSKRASITIWKTYGLWEADFCRSSFSCIAPTRILREERGRTPDELRPRTQPHDARHE
ncbi:unnamed protein product [Leptosia nina]|uniref:Uncharacterized protein n=1 Tax=Leptosia nina TaxID=320188 RepID=A0AAV1IUZ2_9NEOP